MLYRRLVFAWQFPAALVLPVWLFLGRGILSEGLGGQTVALVFLAPALAIAMLATAGIITARRSARTARAVSWQDAALLTAWHVAILALGIPLLPELWSNLAAAFVLMLGLAAFWFGVYELVTETRRRVRGLVANWEQQAARGGGDADPRVIVLEQGQSRDR